MGYRLQDKDDALLATLHSAECLRGIIIKTQCFLHHFYSKQFSKKVSLYNYAEAFDGVEVSDTRGDDSSNAV